MSSVGTHLNTFHDASGRVTVSVFNHVGSPPQQHWVEEEILVGDGDMIAIGGGGNTQSDNPGAFLTASHPNGDLSGWVVSSKDHQITNPHQLITYVIGLKIAGMTREQLRNAVFVSRGESSVAPHPEAETGVPNDTFVLVGGGFRVDFHGAGNIATASFPSTETSWKARSKDQAISDPSIINVFAMCLKRDLPVGQIQHMITRADSSQADHPAAIVNIAPGFALVGGGAEVHTTGNGNLLIKLEPSTDNNPTFEAASADHKVPDPTTLTVYGLGIRL